MIVMPSCAPDKWYESDNKRCTAAARLALAGRSSIRARSTATRANSAATNPALATTSERGEEPYGGVDQDP